MPNIYGKIDPQFDGAALDADRVEGSATNKLPLDAMPTEFNVRSITSIDISANTVTLTWVDGAGNEQTDDFEVPTTASLDATQIARLLPVLTDLSASDDGDFPVYINGGGSPAVFWGTFANGAGFTFTFDSAEGEWSISGGYRAVAALPPANDLYSPGTMLFLTTDRYNYEVIEASGASATDDLGGWTPATQGAGADLRVGFDLQSDTPFGTRPPGWPTTIHSFWYNVSNRIEMVADTDALVQGQALEFTNAAGVSWYLSYQEPAGGTNRDLFWSGTALGVPFPSGAALPVGYVAHADGGKKPFTTSTKSWSRVALPMTQDPDNEAGGAGVTWETLLDWAPAQADRLALTTNVLAEVPLAAAFSSDLTAEDDDDILDICFQISNARTGRRGIWSIIQDVKAGDWRSASNSAAGATVATVAEDAAWTTAGMDSDNTGANFNWSRGVVCKGPNGRIAFIINRPGFVSRVLVRKRSFGAAASGGDAGDGQGGAMGQSDNVAAGAVGLDQLSDAARAALLPTERLVANDDIIVISRSRYAGFSRSNDLPFSQIQPEPAPGGVATELPQVARLTAPDNEAYPLALAFAQSHAWEVPRTTAESYGFLLPAMGTAIRVDGAVSVYTEDLDSALGNQILVALGGGDDTDVDDRRLALVWNQALSVWNLQVLDRLNVVQSGGAVPGNWTNNQRLKIAWSLEGTSTRHNYILRVSINGSAPVSVNWTSNSLEDGLWVVYGNGVRVHAFEGQWHGQMWDLWIRRGATTDTAIIQAASGNDLAAWQAGTLDNPTARNNPYGLSPGFGQFVRSTGAAEYAYNPISLVAGTFSIPSETSGSGARVNIPHLSRERVRGILFDATIDSGGYWYLDRFLSVEAVASVVISAQNTFPADSFQGILYQGGLGGAVFGAGQPLTVATWNRLGVKLVRFDADNDSIDALYFRMLEAEQTTGVQVRNIRYVPLEG